MHCLAVSKSVHNFLKVSLLFFMSDFQMILAPLALRQIYMS